MLFKKWALFFLTCAAYIFSQQKLCFDIENLQALNNIESFVLDELTFSSDLNLDSNEFNYLVELKKGDLVDSTVLKNSCFYLKQKNKFQKICLTITSIDDASNQKKLHFDLYADWTFNCLALSGILTGKDTVLQQYRLEHGDLFDLEKHNHSIDDIKKYFKNKGFLDVKIIQRLDKNESNKSIKVFLHIKKGKRFKITKVDFNFFAEENSIPESLKKKVIDLFEKRLCSSYSTEYLSKIKKSLKKYLIELGYYLTVVELEEFISQTNKEVFLIVKIYLHKKVECFFKGNKSFTSQFLLNNLLALGQSTLSLPVVLLEEELCKFYKSKGFWDASIESQITSDGYYFYINEGDRVNISTIEFVGDLFFKENILAKFFTKVVNRPYFMEEIETAIENLTNFYFKHGFLNCHISMQQTPFNNKNYKLIITINADQKHILKSVKVNEWPSLEKTLLFKTNLDCSFDPSNLVEQKKIISNYLSVHGYKVSNIFPIISYQIIDQEKHVFIDWQIEKIQQESKFGKAIIFGSTNYAFNKILREVSFKPNQFWDRNKLYDTFLKLRNINAFDNVRVYPHSEKDPFGRRPVYIKLFPSNKFEFKTRFGFQEVSKNLTFRGRASYKLGASFEVKS